MSRNSSIEALRAFHKGKISAGAAARIEALVLGDDETDRKRKRTGSDPDVDENEREGQSKRPRSVFVALRDSTDDDFWEMYYAGSKEDQDYIERMVIPVRLELSVNIYGEARPLHRAMDIFDQDPSNAEKVFRATTLRIKPSYGEYMELLTSAKKSGNYTMFSSFTATLRKAVEVTNLITLELQWIHVTNDILDILADHPRLKILDLGEGVSIHDNDYFGAWLEKRKITHLYAPLRFVNATLLANQNWRSVFLHDLEITKPWVFNKKGALRRFPTIQNLGLVEVDTAYASMVRDTTSSARLLTHATVGIHIPKIFPMLKICVYDVVDMRKETDPVRLSYQDLRIFPESCRTVHLTLRAASDILETDRTATMNTTVRNIKTLMLEHDVVSDPVQLDGFQFVKSFPLLKNVGMPYLDILTNTIGQTNQHHWRLIQQRPEWLVGIRLTQTEASFGDVKYDEYLREKSFYRRTTFVDAGILRSRRTTELVLTSVIEQTEPPQGDIVNIPFPHGLKTFVSINDLPVAKMALRKMSNVNKHHLQDVWLLQMSFGDLDYQTQLQDWKIEPYALSDATLDELMANLGPEASINGMTVANIRRIRNGQEIILPREKKVLLYTPISV